MTDPSQSSATPAPAGPLNPAEDRQWASFAHFGGVFWFLPALIIFVIFKDRGVLTKQESKEALNWQITFSIGFFALVIVTSILGVILTLAGLWPIAQLFSLLPWALYIVNLVFSIIGGIKVTQGGTYRYPFAIRLIK